MREPGETVQARIRAAWPRVKVHQDPETGMWHAVIPVAPGGTVGVQRRSLALLEDKIGEVINGAEREQRRAAAPGRTV